MCFNVLRTTERWAGLGNEGSVVEYLVFCSKEKWHYPGLIPRLHARDWTGNEATYM